MTRRYHSFVLRCWQLGSVSRIEVEHRQSGGSTRAATLSGATEWISERCDESDEQVSAPQPVVASGEVRSGKALAGDEERTDDATTDVPGRAHA